MNKDGTIKSVSILLADEDIVVSSKPKQSYRDKLNESLASMKLGADNKLSSRGSSNASRGSSQGKEKVNKTLGSSPGNTTMKFNFVPKQETYDNYKKIVEDGQYCM